LIEPDAVLALIEATLDDDQAEDVTVIDLSGKASFADYMVIASGSSGRKLDAMAAHIQTKLKKAGLRRVATEGQSRTGWILLDAGDVIVHLFRPDSRSYYDLEKLWEPNLAGPTQHSSAAQ